MADRIYTARVTSCAACPNRRVDRWKCDCYCAQDVRHRRSIAVHVNERTFPAWCPLPLADATEAVGK